MAKKQKTKIDAKARDQFILMKVNGASESKIREQSGLTTAVFNATYKAACEKISIAADFDLAAEIGTAKTRLEKLYEMSMDMGDVKTALATQKEINKLARLYDPVPEKPASDAKDNADLAKIKKHLTGLGVGTSRTGPVELARLVAAAIVRYKSQ